MSQSMPPDPQRPASEAPRKSAMSTTDKLLAGILGVLVLLVAAVASLAVVIHLATAPAAVGSGPSKRVKVSVKAFQAEGTAAVTDQTGVTTARLTFGDPGQDWERDVPFGQPIRVDLAVDAAADEGGGSGMLSCSITAVDSDQVLANATAEGTNSVASCVWTNAGQ